VIGTCARGRASRQAYGNLFAIGESAFRITSVAAKLLVIGAAEGSWFVFAKLRHIAVAVLRSTNIRPAGASDSLRRAAVPRRRLRLIAFAHAFDEKLAGVFRSGSTSES